MYKIINYSKASAGIKEFVADAYEDLSKILDCEMGSTCLVVDDSKMYVRNGKKEWKEWVTSNNSEGQSGKVLEISTPEEMDVILENATPDDIGRGYLYVGETTENYESYYVYIIREEEE
jgi:hypothetical protein